MLAKVTKYRAGVGANLNRIEFARANLAATTEGMAAAHGRLMHLDVAHEMGRLLNAKMALESSIVMAAQANLMPKNLLRLFVTA